MTLHALLPLSRRSGASYRHGDTTVHQPSFSLDIIQPELCLNIYDTAFPELKSLGRKEVLVRGSITDIPGQPSKRDISCGPWALVRTCRTIRHELSNILPAIKDVCFILQDLTDSELRSWIACFQAWELEAIRKMHISRWGSTLH